MVPSPFKEHWVETAEFPPLPIKSAPVYAWKVVHVALVSETILSSTIPLLVPELRSSRVVALVSADVRKHAERLARFARRHGIDVTEVHTQPFDYDGVRRSAESAIALSRPFRAVLNVTGGTKIMALAAFDAFRAHGRPVFYLDLANQKVCWLAPQVRQSELPAVLGVQDALEAAGFALGGAERPDPFGLEGNIAWWIGQDARRYAPILAEMKRSLSACRRSEPQRCRIQRDQAAGRLAEKLVEVGMARRQGSWLEFLEPGTRKLIDGGWLELFTYGVLSRARERLGITDIALSARIRSYERDADTDSELDIVFTARNRLYVLECKSALRPPRDVVFRVEVLREMYGGGLGRGGVVCLSGAAPALKRRCSDLGLLLVEGASLPRLEDIVATWIGAS
ncbi:MAG: DUF1887 family protein [Acidobacteria bacterium]|nr:MAG: DUF1887 family protein [Acidobacteriota bacterium]